MTQTNDRRQAIIDRLITILSELTIPMAGDEAGGPTSIPAGNFVHNRNELSENTTPGIILLDADEVRDPRATLPPRGMAESKVPQAVVKMTPEIYVVLDTRTPGNVNVGEDLNAARLAIMAAVLPDSTLQGIVGANGNIQYDGTVTDLARNRQMKGQLGISITFTYPLLVKEYVGI